jgi:allophanate hydrolase subunit 2
LAQRRPGDTLRFRPCTLVQALKRLAAREREMNLLLQRIARRLHQTD